MKRSETHISAGGELLKLTAREQKICEEYSKPGEDGLERCPECPLVIDARFNLCYATIEADDPEAADLHRWRDGDE